MTSAKPAVVVMEKLDVASSRAGERTVLENIDWRVEEGDFWVVGGLQSSGKSDLLSTIIGLQRPIQGRLVLLGEDVSTLDSDDLSRLRRRVGLVFDHGGRMFSHLNVKENVSLPLRYHENLLAAQAEKRVKRMLEAMEIFPFASNTLGVINRSWQQRVALARALILQPELLLLDKPLLGLDPMHMRWWLNFLAQLGRGHDIVDRRPITIIVTDDDLRPWRQEPDRHFALLKQKAFLVLAEERDWEQEDVINP